MYIVSGVEISQKIVKFIFEKQKHRQGCQGNEDYWIDLEIYFFEHFTCFD